MALESACALRGKADTAARLASRSAHLSGVLAPEPLLPPQLSGIFKDMFLVFYLPFLVVLGRNVYLVQGIWPQSETRGTLWK